MDALNPILLALNLATTRPQINRILALGGYDLAHFTHLSDAELRSWIQKLVAVLG